MTATIASTAQARLSPEERWYAPLVAFSRRAGVRAAAVYTLLAVFADLPIWPGDPSQFPTEAGGDIVQTAWFLEWIPQAILHGMNPFFTTAINYPQGVNLSQNTGMQLLALLVAPLTLLASPLASENLLRFLAFPLSAGACYFVLRRWTRFAPAAFVGGLLYGFSPYMVTQGEYHLNLMFVPFPPLILYALFELVVAQQHSARRWGLLLGIFCVCQFYVSSEVLATTGLVAALGLVYLAAFGAGHLRERLRHASAGLGWALLVLVPLVAYPVYEILAGPARYVGPAQGYNNVYNADLLGPLLPTTNMAFAPARLSAAAMKLVGAQVQENGSYLSLPLILLSGYLALRYRRRRWPLFASLMAVSSFVLSLGPHLVIDGRRHAIRLPFSLIDHLPMLENILPVRLSLYVSFFVAVLLALAIDAYHDELAARPRAAHGAFWHFSPARLLLAVVVALCAVSLVPRWPYRTLPFEAGVHYSETAAGLRSVPRGATVLAYPYPTSFFDLAMYWQSLDHMDFRLLGGYALVPKRNGRATIFPTALQPKRVEAMLINSVTEVADPNIPDLVATQHTITAREVIVVPPGTNPRALHATLVGRVGSVDRPDGQFYLYPTPYVPTAVRYSATTRFVDAGVAHPTIDDIWLARRVAVIGESGPGTVDAGMVGGLRSFLGQNHVTAVVLGLGITDAAEMANWFRAALGKPTRSGGGAMIWTDVRSVLARPLPRAAPAVPAPG